MSDQRVTCSRHHWLFSVTIEGIAIKCRAGECRAVYTIPWSEIEAKRAQATSGRELPVDEDASYLHISG